MILKAVCIPTFNLTRMKTIENLLFGWMLMHPMVWAQSQKGQKPTLSADYWAEIPTGSLKIPDKGDVALSTFYMGKTEISNADYRAFIAWLIENKQGPKAQQLLPDTTVWRTIMGYHEPLVNAYFRHPAYANYPLVGVSREMALAYCEWLSGRMNDNLHALFPKWKNKKVTVRLPSETEWLYAACSGLPSAAYPWKESFLKNRKGNYLCNFKKMAEECITYNASTGKMEQLEYCPRGSYMGIAGRLNDEPYITAPINAYWPNGYGLFNMAGNVSEMVSDARDAKGGSWRVCGADVAIFSKDPFAEQDTPRADRGFRVAMTVSDK